MLSSTGPVGRYSLLVISLMVGALSAPTTARAGITASDESIAEAEASSADLYPLSAHEEDELSRFRVPTTAPSLMTEPNPNTPPVALDPQGVIPKPLLEKAVAYYQTNLTLIGNTASIGIINFSARSTEPRFFILDMSSGSVRAFRVAHGRGSDAQKGDGFATQFGNVANSHMSSLGFYRTASIYKGKHGRSLRLDGLSETNSNARSRAVVIHGAEYVHEASTVQGRSYGCPAISMSVRDQVIDALKDGAIIYAGL